MEKGKLYIVSTPIGNLEDITYRAVKILQQVDIVAAEDSRHTRKLLSHFNVHKKILSYHDHNKISCSRKLLELLLSNKDIALVSDAGTPCISDPGFYLIRKALDNDIGLIPIPGPSSVLASLIMSGLPTDRFVFEGFLPRRKGKKKKKLIELADETRTIILFESPYRIVNTLEEIYSIFGNRKIAIAREITKKYEETIRTELQHIVFSDITKLKGEITLVVEGKPKD